MQIRSGQATRQLSGVLAAGLLWPPWPSKMQECVECHFEHQDTGAAAIKVGHMDDPSQSLCLKNGRMTMLSKEYMYLLTEANLFSHATVIRGK